EQQAGQPVFGSADSRHGRRAGRRRQPGTGRSARVPHGASLGPRTAAVLPARRQDVRSDRGDPRASEFGLRSERYGRQLRVAEHRSETGSAELPEIAVEHPTVDYGTLPTVCRGGNASTGETAWEST